MNIAISMVFGKQISKNLKEYLNIFRRE